MHNRKTKPKVEKLGFFVYGESCSHKGVMCGVCPQFPHLYLGSVVERCDTCIDSHGALRRLGSRRVVSKKVSFFDCSSVRKYPACIQGFGRMG